MGVISGIDALLSVKKLKKGKSAFLSIAQIASMLINLVDAKKSLSDDKYNQIYELFISMQRCNKKIEFNWLSCLATCSEIIQKFDAIAPYRNYSGASLIENCLWEKVASMKVATTHNYYNNQLDFDPVQWSSSKPLDNAYNKITAFAAGFYACGNKNEFGGLILYIAKCCNFCLDWCILCGDKEGKKRIVEAKNGFLNEFSNLGPQNTNIAADIDAFFEENYNTFSKFRKEVIVPAYREDSSEENRDVLIKVYLEQVCKFLGINWYDGIVEDFKHCMDE